MTIVNFVIDEERLHRRPRGSDGQQTGGRWPPRRPRHRPRRARPASAAATWRAWLIILGYLALAIASGVSSVQEINENPELYMKLASAPPMGGF